MNNIAIYREQFQSVVQEIARTGGHVTKIYHNQVFFTNNKVNYVFAPQMTEGGPLFIKHEAKAFSEVK